MSQNRVSVTLWLWLALVLLATSCATRSRPGWTPDYAAGDVLLDHETWVIASELLAEDRRINLYLPPDYESDADRSFPVLYMPDGGVQEDFPHVTHTLDSLITAGSLPPMLVVGIENTERRRDLTGPTRVDSDREIAPRVGGSVNFREFIRRELMPEIERRYRTNGTTAIIGESLAGLFIVESFFEAPEMFDVYIAISPSLWWNDQILVKNAPAWLVRHTEVSARMYLTHADERDIASGTAELVNALTSHPVGGLEWIYKPRPDLEHHTIYRATKRAALIWALGSAK